MNQKQIYADVHFHSNCSPDSVELLQKHVNSAHAQGFSHLCVTDHWDLVDDPATTNPDIPFWISEFEKVVVPPDLTLNFGVEMGDAYNNLEIAQKILQEYPFDFVLGSVHALNKGDGVSIYYGFKDCDTPEKVEQFFLDYFDTLILQSTLTNFDSLSHIIYPFRYLPPDSPIQLTNYLPQITTVLENLIKNNKAMEFNTTQGTTLEIWRPILTRYQELGGKLLTFGSDAHRNIHTGLGIPEGISMVKSMGFKEYHIFQKRNLVEIPMI